MKMATSVGQILILKIMEPIGTMHNLLWSGENIQLTVLLTIALIQMMKLITKKILIQSNGQANEQLKLIKKSHEVLLKLDLMAPI